MSADSSRFFVLFKVLATVAVVVVGFASILGTSGNGSISPADFADAGPDQSVSLGSKVRLDGRGSFIPRKGNADVYLTYIWEFQQTPELTDAVLTNADRVNPTFVADSEGVFVIKLTARTTTVGHQDADDITITVYDTYGAPVADAGPDQDVKKGQLVTLDGSLSYDPDFWWDYRDIEAFNWDLVEAPAGAGAPEILSGCNPAFEAAATGSYIYWLTVEDDEGVFSEPDEVTINVTENHQAGMPGAVAGPDQNVVTGSVVQLDGGDSYDPDDRPLDYYWRIIAKPYNSLAQLSDATSLTPTFAADRDGVYVVRLFVGNGTEPSSFSVPVDSWHRDLVRIDYHDQDRVIVNASSTDLPPVADAGLDLIVPLSEPVALDGSGSYHPEGNDLLYEWNLLFEPAGDPVNLSGETSSAVSFTPEAAGSYGFQLRVHDKPPGGGFGGSWSAMDRAVVIATDNQAPIADAGEDINNHTTGPVSLDGSGSYDPDGGPVSYCWSYVLGPVIDFPEFSDPLSSAPSFTPEENGLYVVRLLVHDGELSSVADTVAVTVTGIVDLPELSLSHSTLLFGDSLNDLAFTVENTGEASLIWSITPDLPGWLNAVPMSGIDGDGETSGVAVSVDRTGLAEGSYSHPISVTSNGGNLTVDVGMSVAGSSGAEALTVVPSLPWTPSGAEIQTVFYLDLPSVGQITLGETVPVSEAALVATLNSITAADFTELTANGWEAYSRTHTNPVSESASPSFVLKRTSDNIYFKITVDFTVVDSMFYVQVDELSAWRCGSSAGDCP